MRVQIQGQNSLNRIRSLCRKLFFNSTVPQCHAATPHGFWCRRATAGCSCRAPCPSTVCGCQTRVCTSGPSSAQAPAVRTPLKSPQPENNALRSGGHSGQSIQHRLHSESTAAAKTEATPTTKKQNKCKLMFLLPDALQGSASAVFKPGQPAVFAFSACNPCFGIEREQTKIHILLQSFGINRKSTGMYQWTLEN